jgi:multimeric flavodoxin WrbA
MPAIRHRMHDADGVIFASPVNSRMVAGRFKVFIDRITCTVHRARRAGVSPSSPPRNTGGGSGRGAWRGFLPGTRPGTEPNRCSPTR